MRMLMEMRGMRRILWMIVCVYLSMLLQVVHGVLTCANTEFEAKDSRGKDCGHRNYYSGNNCGFFDNSQFTANQMCCDCGGGFTWELGSHDEEWDASAPYCYDDTGNGQLDLDQFVRAFKSLGYIKGGGPNIPDDAIVLSKTRNRRGDQLIGDVFSKGDADKDGLISIQEFLEVAREIEPEG